MIPVASARTIQAELPSLESLQSLYTSLLHKADGDQVWIMDWCVSGGTVIKVYMFPLVQHHMLSRSPDNFGSGHCKCTV